MTREIGRDQHETDEPPRITIDDVAARAGVSTATVSRVLNRSGTVAPATSARVRQAIADMGYIPHAAARDLARGKTHVIGLVLPATTTLYFSTLMRGISLTAAAHQYALLIYVAIPAAQRTADMPQILGQHNTDGLIVFTDSVDDETLRRLNRRHFPLVLLHRPPPAGLDLPVVLYENIHGAYDLVTHLVTRCGHRRVAYLRGPVGNQDSDEREAGYRRALADQDIPIDPALIGRGDFRDDVAFQQVSRWLADGRRLDAVFAGDDYSAIGAISAVRAAGLRVPDDIAVVGFNDVFNSQYLAPPLTTVRAPTEAAGAAAARQLIALIEGNPAAAVTRLPTELVIRESCGCRLQ